MHNHVGSVVAWSEVKTCRWRLKTAGVSPVHVQANADVVRSAMKSPQASVRQCAMRVFKLLGGDTLPDSSHTPAAASAVAAPDLMGNLLGEEDAPAAAPQDYLGEYRQVLCVYLQCSTSRICIIHSNQLFRDVMNICYNVQSQIELTMNSCTVAPAKIYVITSSQLLMMCRPFTTMHSHS